LILYSKITVYNVKIMAQKTTKKKPPISG